ncbi:Homeodomain-like protein [Metarhizium album ARSEF 1941]|uniref:Homeodomain-like protein n=1 Tax=Metarhizium album (strain ARSEF 1941) TaxID=1081103 RepID=A0A0B2X884_METAS|nr:Homeodomain-like protein [Metarhizium album ARSEF 1941]KHO01516.1 Homeodomain-like protein [Metarhizium album ARSEF 1941]
MGTDLYAYPRLTEASNLYRSHSDLNLGAKWSDRDHKERISSQDAEFDVYDEDADDDRVAHYYHQTVAERIVARRKIKRFRLTHQQTRFLMREFAKQPHPDAAHRERLSREIPGLSPRQVQVWFQNRRAKIKRLTVDDRDRMIQMRAVPDDFDNLQALHSPYGAVNGIGSCAPPSTLGLVRPSYRTYEARALMTDMRSSAGESYMSPPAPSQPLGSFEAGQSGGPASSDVANNMYHDRYVGSSSPASSTPGPGYQTSATYWNSPANNADVSSPHSTTKPQPRKRYFGVQSIGTANKISNLFHMHFRRQRATVVFWSIEDGYAAGLPSRGSRNDMELEGSGKHRAGSPRSAVDYGFRDQLRVLTGGPASAQLQDRPQGLPSLKIDTSSPSSYTNGPLSAPLEILQMQCERTVEYPASPRSATQQPSSRRLETSVSGDEPEPED